MMMVEFDGNLGLDGLLVSRPDLSLEDDLFHIDAHMSAPWLTQRLLLK
eukprot:14920.XXX_1264187_1264843_1 [CDS] Oithona nana genome sequencing.